ncbi:DUF433 domain-containing protein [Streptomyces sp. NPDC007076]|uniref:DUF433 domain-containing protein n=1 Tax=unclassified Streptomyces TaxID=2593676 RepID=UPI002E2FF7D7|nr:MULTISPECIES: DUF433 domain-containing protein [unclassified Streptomyces]MEE1839875.1 DUF433 domain-containing protein [Streptomyces sp. JV190]
MVNKFRDPIMTPLETARHLRINERTLYRWLHEKAAGEPLVHAVEAEKRGGPSVPFVAVVEAYVLHALRDLGLSLHKIREAAEAVRREFGEPYGLATRRIATDGVEIFVDHAGDLARARDGQRPIREVIEDYLRYITWEADGRTPQRLRLMQYPDVAPVIIDPRFGWGAPVVASNKVQVDAIVGLWQAGEPLEVVGDEFGLSRDEVEAILRAAQSA